MIEYRDTSRDAWDSFDAVSGDLDREILVTIRRHHPAGITCDAIEVAIDRKHQSVSGNLRHLVERGLVEDSGERALIRSGRTAILWVLSELLAPPPPSPPEPRPESPSPGTQQQLDLF